MAGIITLSIIGALIALITLLLFLKISLIIRYDEGAALTLKILFVKIRLYPKKEKKHRKKSMSAKKAARIKDKLERKKAKKKAKKAEKKAKKRDGKKKTTPSDILETISTVAILVRQIVSNFVKYVRIKIVRIHVKIATGDAAQTAIAYGALTQGINVLFPLLEDVKNFSMPKNRDIDIYPDFLSEDSEIELKLIFSLRVWQIAATALSTLYRLSKNSIKSLERKERKNHGK